MMNDEIDTFLIDHDPAKLLPYSKRLLPEDPEAVDAGRHFMRDTYQERNDDKQNYGSNELTSLTSL
jgi:hypothetical protein